MMSFIGIKILKKVKKRKLMNSETRKFEKRSMY